ncbi:ATP-binding protein [Paenibacillus sp. GCM10012307]|uniref:Heme sensor protein HssS n=1 Tax=Paenibacillus roseus TaxID=2798579 RepID=A0A934MW12_9BACL|nr:HAMP domain-containing sensor histidine kinase [Paenibacillus roseus]MBJ6362682.1 HAMP domain-containing histidine kinase [Paenibacillus roseus]
MIKSLYVRVILVFLAAVIGSLVLTLLLYGKLYGGQVKTVIQDSLIESGKTIIQSYEQSYPDNLEPLIEGISALPIYTLNIYDQQGTLLHQNLSHTVQRIAVNDQQVEQVLSGGVLRGKVPGPNHSEIVVGLPFQVGGKSYALFLSPEASHLERMLTYFFRSQLLLVLLFGSLLILIAAGYIVRPLRQLTHAARQMARGDFSFRLETRRRDEIGELARSFNLMAKELGALEKSRKQFVSDVSHEFKSPLTSIKGFTQALKHKKLDEESRLRLLDIMETETDRLSRLSGDLLQLSTLEYEHFQLDTRVFRLDEQLRKSVIAFEPQWLAKNIDVELQLADLPIRADEDRLNLVWTNLISNSIKFTEPDGTIRITLERDNDTVNVEIADTGSGIPQDELDQIFKPFYKVDRSRDRTASSGSGIGLSIVKRIVALHDGNIRVTSQLGEGTIFVIHLPSA